MNLESLRQKLLFTARRNPPADRVPYAFEKRIMARLATRPALDVAGMWARGLWRAVAPCVVVTVLIGVWSLISAESKTTPTTAAIATTTTTATAESYDFAQHFERTMLAAVDEPSEETW